MGGSQGYYHDITAGGQSVLIPVNGVGPAYIGGVPVSVKGNCNTPSVHGIMWEEVGKVMDDRYQHAFTEEISPGIYLIIEKDSLKETRRSRVNIEERTIEEIK